MDTDVYEGMVQLAQLCDLAQPHRHNNTSQRLAAELYAQELHDMLINLNHANKLPEFVVPASLLRYVPQEALAPSEVTLAVRMDKLEKAVTELTNKVAKDIPASVPKRSNGDRSGGSFGPALERARSVSVSSNNGRQQQPRTESQPGEQSSQQTWADTARAGGVKRRNPGVVDSDGFRLPGRPRKQAPRGKSTIDLSELGSNIVAPVERYIGNTDLSVTKETVAKVLQKCAQGLGIDAKLDIVSIEQDGMHLKNRRTKCWKVTVPYRCKELMDKPEMYPDGWTHRAYFTPRDVRSKRPKQNSGVAELPLKEVSRNNMETNKVDAVLASNRLSSSPQVLETVGMAVSNDPPTSQLLEKHLP